MTKGVLYIATGTDYIEEACQSARSVKSQNNLPITLVSDSEPDKEIFDEIKIIKDPDMSSGDKILNILKSEYDKTLLLDTDTYVCGDLSPIFELLDKYELAIAEEPFGETSFLENVPKTYPEYNTGVIGYRQTEPIQSLVELWHDYYFQIKENAKFPSKVMDQPSFRKSSYETELKMSVLPTEYNCRYSVMGCLQNRAIILHGRVPYIDEFANKLNMDPDQLRIFYHTLNDVKMYYYVEEGEKYKNM
jgi:hypothetical protein